MNLLENSVETIAVDVMIEIGTETADIGVGRPEIQEILEAEETEIVGDGEMREIGIRGI